MPTETATMARPKSKPKSGPPIDDRVAIIHLKGTPAYAEWLEATHRKTHIPKAVIFRVAVEEWAQRNGFDPPPEM